MSVPMVRAILEGQKTQTRRVVIPQPEHIEWFEHQKGWCARVAPHRYEMVCCPYGKSGDRLWVRESFVRHISIPQLFGYAADGYTVTERWERLAPSIHMPRGFCRLVLELTDVRVERLQDITHEDILAEGSAASPYDPKRRSYTVGEVYREGYQLLWDSLNAKRGYGWDVNPWVWALTFRTLPAA